MKISEFRFKSHANHILGSTLIIGMPMSFEKEYEVKDIEELSPYNIYFYLRELADKWEVLALRTVNG